MRGGCDARQEVFDVRRRVGARDKRFFVCETVLFVIDRRSWASKKTEPFEEGSVNICTKGRGKKNALAQELAIMGVGAHRDRLIPIVRQAHEHLRG